MVKRIFAIFVIFMIGIMFLFNEASAQVRRDYVVLVTEREARLPDSQIRGFDDFLKEKNLFDTFWSKKSTEIEKGPEIELISPREGRIYSEVFDILVRFVPKETDIDFSSLNVEYMKLWGINITDRVLPYASREGIKVENAKFPSGNHSVKISIADLNGNFSSKVFRVTVK